MVNDNESEEALQPRRRDLLQDQSLVESDNNLTKGANGQAQEVKASRKGRQIASRSLNVYVRKSNGNIELKRSKLQNSEQVELEADSKLISPEAEKPDEQR